MRIPNKHEGYAADGVRLYPIDSGGGGGGDATQTQIVDLPDWAKPYAKEGLGRAAALTDTTQNPYQTYAGSRQADFTGLQNQAFHHPLPKKTFDPSEPPKKQTRRSPPSASRP